MIISHVKIIVFQLYCFPIVLLEKTVVYLINREIHVCLEIPCSTLEINLVFPRTHILCSIYLRRVSPKSRIALQVARKIAPCDRAFVR